MQSAVAQRQARFTAMVVVASPFIRESIGRTLRQLGASDIVEASSLAEARVRAHGAVTRDLCIIEGTLPDGSGITLFQELRSAGWSRGVVLSAADDPYAVRGALAAGVRAFLVSASASTAAGEQPSATSGPIGIARPRNPRPTGTDGLSGREIEVLQLVSEGRSNKDIGEALGLSSLTVKSHLARIARKLGSGDRAQMVVFAMRAGVVA